VAQTASAGAALKVRLAAKLVEHARYIREYGQDMPDIRNWTWKVPKLSPDEMSG
jgi:xylulose-5-phosphate/fructose-6-phosphate phosphoketolase